MPLQLDPTLNRSALNTIVTTAGINLNSINPTFVNKLVQAVQTWRSSLKLIGIRGRIGLRAAWLLAAEDSS